jgi:hypothetical protein
MRQYVSILFVAVQLVGEIACAMIPICGGRVGDIQDSSRRLCAIGTRGMRHKTVEEDCVAWGSAKRNWRRGPACSHQPSRILRLGAASRHSKIYGGSPRRSMSRQTTFSDARASRVGRQQRTGSIAISRNCGRATASSLSSGSRAKWRTISGANGEPDRPESRAI